MGNILWFKEVNKSDIPKVGGKGANLGEMFSSFPVPNGFCVTVDAFNSILDDKIRDKLKQLNDIDVEETNALEKKAEEIRDMIKAKKFPEDLKSEILSNFNKLSPKVAVRSSATAEDLEGASFAGQQDTFLNVTEKDLIDSVQKCWASMFTARAVYYRSKKGFRHDEVSIAVVIQEMVDAEFAGVIFTVDPIHKKHILIEVVEGLGEALVSGEKTPNTYFVDKKDNKIIDKNLQFNFDEGILFQIADISRKVEKHYKMPMDIEIAIKEKIFVLQARPITTI